MIDHHFCVLFAECCFFILCELYEFVSNYVRDNCMHLLYL